MKNKNKNNDFKYEIVDPLGPDYNPEPSEEDFTEADLEKTVDMPNTGEAK